MENRMQELPAAIGGHASPPSGLITSAQTPPSAMSLCRCRWMRTSRIALTPPHPPPLGGRVIVPFRNERIDWRLEPAWSDEPPPVEAKTVERILDDEAMLSPQLLELARWIASTIWRRWARCCGRCCRWWPRSAEEFCIASRRRAARRWRRAPSRAHPAHAAVAGRAGSGIRRAQLRSRRARR